MPDFLPERRRINRWPSAEPAADQEPTRLNRYLAMAGCCSRREADRLIEAGVVKVDGVTAGLGTVVMPGQQVHLRGTLVTPQKQFIYIALNKPPGITCTSDRRRSDNIVDFIGLEERIFTIGRLDRDSEGLIFLTDDGAIVNRILRAGNRHEKEYLVEVDRDLTPEMRQQMERGVPILQTVTLPCRVIPITARRFRIILVQGLNRQIRRMCAYFGLEVLRLVRIRIMNVSLGTLKTGAWRYLTAKEVTELRRLADASEQRLSESRKRVINPESPDRHQNG